jgi:hypothetical protein
MPSTPTIRGGASEAIDPRPAIEIEARLLWCAAHRRRWRRLGRSGPRTKRLACCLGPQPPQQPGSVPGQAQGTESRELQGSFVVGHRCGCCERLRTVHLRRRQCKAKGQTTAAEGKKTRRSTKWVASKDTTSSTCVASGLVFLAIPGWPPQNRQANGRKTQRVPRRR